MRRLLSQWSLNSISRWVVYAAACGWFFSILSGFALLLNYKLTAGAHDIEGRAWPMNVDLQRIEGQKTLLLFAHPRCPCTRATLAEFSRIVNRRHEHLTTRIIFFTPQSAEETWLHSDIVDHARAIPATEIVWDREGELARQFGVETSGHVLLFSEAGELLFSGGVTNLRGHQGWSAGGESLAALLHGQSTSVEKTPVYGCSLKGLADFDAETCSKRSP